MAFSVSDAVIVAAARTAVQDVLKGDVIQILIDDLIQPFPYGDREALLCTGTVYRAGLETCHRCQIALCDAQDLSHGVFLRLFREPIAPLIAPVGAEQVGFVQQRNDLFQLFFRDILPFGDILQLNIAVPLILCQIQQHAQGIAPFG